MRFLKSQLDKGVLNKSPRAYEFPEHKDEQHYLFADNITQQTKKNTDKVPSFNRSSNDETNLTTIQKGHTDQQAATDSAGYPEAVNQLGGISHLSDTKVTINLQSQRNARDNQLKSTNYPEMGKPGQVFSPVAHGRDRNAQIPTSSLDMPKISQINHQTTTNNEHDSQVNVGEGEEKIINALEAETNPMDGLYSIDQAGREEDTPLDSVEAPNTQAVENKDALNVEINHNRAQL